MDNTKRMFTGMALAMLVIFGYQFFVSWLWKYENWKLPNQPEATTQQVASTSPSTQPDATSTSVTTAPSGIAATTQAGIHLVLGADTFQLATIGSGVGGDPTYAMQLRLEPHGGAIAGVTLNQFKLKIDAPDLYTYDQPDDMADDNRAMAGRSITFNGRIYDLANVPWTLETSSAGEATYTVTIDPIARIRKTYKIDTRTEVKNQKAVATASEGYEVTVTLSVENLSGAPLTFQTSFNGPPPSRPEASRLDRTMLGGYDNAGYVEMNYHVLDELTAAHPSRDLTRSDKGSLPLVWAGFGGTYFNAILRPMPTSQNVSPAQYLQKVEAVAIDPETPREHPLVRMTFTTADQTIAPGKSLAIPVKLFLGPKQRALLNNNYYSSPAIAYDNTLVMASGVCGYCTFTWLIDVLVNMLRAFHFVLRDWGLAIILLVVVVRMLLHPITKKSQINMLKMSKMGPETERLKKKFGDDKEALSKAQMQMYKEMGFTPILGCLPMFLQMPIFIALWQALQSTFELRHSPFLYFFGAHFTWIKDLSQPDRLIHFGQSLNLGLAQIDAINLLPLLVAVVSFLNMKYTPRPPAATPEAEQQQKMMQWMTLIFPLLFYKLPSGLNIYYLTSTSLGIWEGRRIRAHLEAHKEAEKEGKIIVDASPSKRGRSTKSDTTPDKPKTGLSGWLARLQEKAEQVRGEAEKKNRKRS